jgi:UDP-N-acetylglucosamine/UDP-N-acetylgalactosamine diphosphorylase
MEPDPNLVARLARHGQEGLLRWWDDLDDRARARLVAEVESIDLDGLDELIRTLVLGHDDATPAIGEVGPVEVFRLPQTDGERASRRQVAEVGEEALRRGEVAVVLVAGGSGTRLGFEGPKGTYPIGPVSGASLFQIHAEKIVALGRRYGHHLPLYVMTSPDNHEATARFFGEHDRFGLKHLRLFVQGQMPAVDRESGRVLLASKGEVALSPDGHGGTIAALAARGPDGGPSCLEEMAARGIKTVFYFQVDNPLVKNADPAFLGLHLHARAEMSFKVIEKVAPDEKVGVVVSVDGVPQVIE